MKKMKKGFTLAEVLITLSIIGIVAAIVMPGVVSSYNYKTIGVKLSKFASSLENTSRAYIAQNTSFETNAQVTEFINDSFLIKELTGTVEQDDDLIEQILGENADSDTFYTVSSTVLSNLPDKYTQTGMIGLLKDNTSVTVSMVTPEEMADHPGVVDSHKVGLPVFNINVDPKVTGLPSSVQKTFNFVVTELGFVFPNNDDDCLWEIYNADWQTKSSMFKDGSSCNNRTTGDHE